MPTVEDQYLDVLQNIEFGIVSVYRTQAEMTDHAVMRPWSYKRATRTMLFAIRLYDPFVKIQPAY